LRKAKGTDQTPADGTPVNGAAKTRTRRTPTELFMDAVKERKERIASLKAELDREEKAFASFIEWAKAAMEV